eukprot:725027-Amorphochlora_amoeboformis.AAC.1
MLEIAGDPGDLLKFGSLSPSTLRFYRVLPRQNGDSDHSVTSRDVTPWHAKNTFQKFLVFRAHIP